MKKMSVISHEKGNWIIEQKFLAEMMSADDAVRKGFIHVAKFGEGSGQIPLEDDYRKIWRKFDEVVLMLDDYIGDLEMLNNTGSIRDLMEVLEERKEKGE